LGVRGHRICGGLRAGRPGIGRRWRDLGSELRRKRWRGWSIGNRLGGRIGAACRLGPFQTLPGRRRPRRGFRGGGRPFGGGRRHGIEERRFPRRGRQPFLGPPVHLARSGLRRRPAIAPGRGMGRRRRRLRIRQPPQHRRKRQRGQGPPVRPLACGPGLVPASRWRHRRRQLRQEVRRNGLRGGSGHAGGIADRMPNSTRGFS
jgi:hypothetical protein